MGRPATSSAPAIPRAIVDEVRARTDIVALIGRSVELRSVSIGKCPFHEGGGHTLIVSPNGVFHCLVCGEGGDAFAFVMKVRGLGLDAAVRELAAAAGVTVPEPTTPVAPTSPGAAEEPAWVPSRDLARLIWLLITFPEEIHSDILDGDPLKLSDRASVHPALIALKAGTPWSEVARATDDPHLARALRAISAQTGVYTREQAGAQADALFLDLTSPIVPAPDGEEG